MLIDLLAVWNNIAPLKEIERLQALGTKSDLSIDDRFIQSSFEFTTPAKVVFVDSQHSLKPVHFYDRLPSLLLTKEEQGVIDSCLEILKKNPKFYDGDHILLKNVLFDSNENVVYLEAVKVKYSFLAAIQAKKFPQDSHLYHLNLYKTGVIAPFITEDDYTFLMQRKDKYRLYSAASGFLEAEGAKKAISFNKGKKDLVVHTAEKEAIEEFLGTSSDAKACRVKMDPPSITSISFRESKDTPINTVEFIAPIRLRCSKGDLEGILQDNQAKDKNEHTGLFDAIPLGRDKRKEAVVFLELNQAGKILYDPILLATSRIANPSIPFFPCFLPGSRTSAIPIEALTPRPFVGWHWKKHQEEGTKPVSEEGKDVLALGEELGKPSLRLLALK